MFLNKLVATHFWVAGTRFGSPIKIFYSFVYHQLPKVEYHWPGWSNHADHVAAVTSSGFLGVMMMSVVTAMVVSVVEGGCQAGRGRRGRRESGRASSPATAGTGTTAESVRWKGRKRSLFLSSLKKMEKHNFKHCNRVCHRFRLTQWDDYFWVTFEASLNFLGSFGSSKNWLEPKTKPP